MKNLTEEIMNFLYSHDIKASDVISIEHDLSDDGGIYSKIQLKDKAMRYYSNYKFAGIKACLPVYNYNNQG